MNNFKLIQLILAFLRVHSSEALNDKKFPNDFLFGVATSAYQIEGGHDVNGKGENIWDHWTKKNPKMIRDLSNGNIACDSYNKYKEDVALVKNLGVNFYRFSLSWTRILPDGYSNKVNPDGIRYYNSLINELRANQIEPMITLYHYDLPQKLQELGGWTNPLMADYFEDYVRVVFALFGDRVKYWITFNACCVGYDGIEMAPLMNQSGIADYLCTKITLLAHSRAYHLYNDQFRSKQEGKVGITVDSKWYEPATNSFENHDAAERTRKNIIGIFLNPIYGVTGNFPADVIKRIEKISKREGFPKSRLPELSKEEIDYIRGTSDFLGINSYTTFLISNVDEDSSLEPLRLKDIRIRLSQNPDWPRGKSAWLNVVPWGLRKMLKWLKDEYNNPEIFITENGFSDDGQIDDKERINYYQSHLSAVLDSIYEDKVNVRAYTTWSLLDNFEWTAGYTEKFGLYHVDFNDPNRKRTAKSSAKWYKKIISQRSLVDFEGGGVKGEL